MTRKPTRPQRLITIAGLLAAACSDAGSELDDETVFDPVAGGEAALGVTCVADDPCSGGGDVYASTYRIGATPTARGLLVQTFQATTTGPVRRVGLLLRHLRPFSSATPPLVHVELREPADPLLPSDEDPLLASGARAASAIVTGTPFVVELGASAALEAGHTYALHLWADGVDAEGTGTVLIGVGALQESTYAGGAALRAGQRRAAPGDDFLPSPPRFRAAGTWDLAFAFAGGAGSACDAGAPCGTGLGCLSGTCAAPNPVPPAISPATVTLVEGQAQTFSVTGGDAPFTYTLVSGPGSIAGSQYTAATVGSATVRVTDAFGRTSDAAITIGSAAKKVFITSTTFTGNLGGLSGADASCQSLANTAGLTGTYKAWLSTLGLSAASRLTHSTGPYELVNGTRIANDWADLTDGTIAAAINRTESNGSKVNAKVWTGTNTNGAVGTTGDCAGWTSGTLPTGAGGYHGFNAATNCRWTHVDAANPTAGSCTTTATMMSCANPFSLYCFQQ